MLIKSYLKEVGSALYEQADTMDFAELCKHRDGSPSGRHLNYPPDALKYAAIVAACIIERDSTIHVASMVSTNCET